MKLKQGSVRRVTSDDVLEWYQAGDVPMAIGDALDGSSGARMTVGFARYQKGARNAWTVSYDEALVITRGTFSVRTDDGGVATAKAGEVIFLKPGAKVVYEANEDAELVYVTYPHWAEATRSSPYASRLDEFHPAAPPH